LNDAATTLRQRCEDALAFLGLLPCCLPDAGATDPYALTKPPCLPCFQRGSASGTQHPIVKRDLMYFKFYHPETRRLVEDKDGRHAWALLPATAMNIQHRTGWLASPL